jgi:hypothetical protein
MTCPDIHAHKKQYNLIHPMLKKIVSNNLCPTQWVFASWIKSWLESLETPTQDVSRIPDSQCELLNKALHQGGGKPGHIKMTLFGLYLIHHQPHLSIFESFWFDKESQIWNRVRHLKRIADPNQV